MTEQVVEILLGEDNAEDVELTVHALRKEKLANRIHVARDGEEALDFLFHNSHAQRSKGLPKVVLLDLKLPKVDGLEVLKRVKTNQLTKKGPTGNPNVVQRGDRLGQWLRLRANSYIQKPVDFGQFRKIVKNLGSYWLVVNEPGSAGAIPNGN